MNTTYTVRGYIFPTVYRYQHCTEQELSALIEKFKRGGITKLSGRRRPYLRIDLVETTTDAGGVRTENVRALFERAGRWPDETLQAVGA